eukprot:2699571-Amphidinium_carterae.1
MDKLETSVLEESSFTLGARFFPKSHQAVGERGAELVSKATCGSSICAGPREERIRESRSNC